MEFATSILNAVSGLVDTILAHKVVAGIIVVFGLVGRYILKGIIDDTRAVLLNVSDIWETYWKHLNNGRLPKNSLEKIKEDKWYILASCLINNTSLSIFHYPYGHIAWTNRYVMFRCQCRQFCIRIKLWWLKKCISYHEWHLRRIERKEYAYYRKRVLKGIEEYSKQQQVLLDKKIEHFWERGWNEIRRLNATNQT